MARFLRPERTERPRMRVALTDNSHTLHLRRAVIDFLYTRQAQVEKLVA